MSVKKNINALVRPKPTKQLGDAKTKVAIASQTGAAETEDNTEVAVDVPYKSPFTEVSRTVEVVRIFNDANPTEWVDMKRTTSLKLRDANGKELEMILNPDLT